MARRHGQAFIVRVEQVSSLLNHFQIPLQKQGVDLNTAKKEWGQLKQHVATYYTEVALATMLKAIFQKKRDTFINF